MAHLAIGVTGKLELVDGSDDADFGSPPCATTTEPVRIESVSVSQLNTAERCERRWFFQKVRRVELPPMEKKAARTGTEIHKVHENYYRKGFVPKGHKHERKVLASLQNLPVCGPGVEVEVPFRIEEANEVPFTGFIDLVDERLLEAPVPTLRIVDHKTTSAIAKKESNPVDMLTDPQMLTYAEVGYRLYSAERVEVAHNTISTTHVARVLPPVFVHVPREVAAANWERQRGNVRKMLMLAAAPPADWNDVRCNTEACMDFGGCDYLPICALKTPTIGVAPMSHDSDAASALLARLNALSAPPVAQPPPSRTIEVIDETPTTPIAIDAAPLLEMTTPMELFETNEIQLLPPDAPNRMTPVVVEDEKPKAKRGRKAKSGPAAETTPTAALPVEYFAEKSIGNVEEAVAYLNERAEEGVRLMGIFDGLYFIFERPRY